MYSNDFYKYIKKSPRLYDGAQISQPTPNRFQIFWESHIGSYITLMRTDENVTKSTITRSRRSSTTLEDYRRDNNIHDPENTTVLYMKVILSAIQVCPPSNNIFCMVRVYNTDGKNIVDKWVNRKRVENIIDTWMSMYPNTNVEEHLTSSDKIKNYTDLDEINSDDSTSPRSPSSPRTPPQCDGNAKVKTKSKSYIAKKFQLRQRSNSSNTIRRRPEFNLSLSDILKPDAVDTNDTSTIT